MELLVEDDRAAYFAATLIIVVALVAYYFWFRQAAEDLQHRLSQMAALLRGSQKNWNDILGDLREQAEKNSGSLSAWTETERRFFHLPTESGISIRLLGAPRDIWSAPRLLSKSINVSLAEAVPNILVGVGLLFTFFFLTIAITDAAKIIGTVANNSNDAATSQFVDQAGRMLRAAGAKFATSLAGLLASIVWTYAMRRRLAAVSATCDDLLEGLERWVPSSGIEDLLRLHAGKTSAIEEHAIESLDIANEILDQAREQTGALKRFETDLAVSLAGAITTAFTPQMEAMTNKLTGAINDLSKNLTAINQDALKELFDEFKSNLNKNTETEMEGFRAALVKLAEKLDSAGTNIGERATDAATRLGEAGDGLVEKVGAVATTLAGGATNLEAASQSLKESINDLDVMIENATAQGEAGTAFLRSVLQSGETVAGVLSAAGGSLQTTVGLLENISQRLGEALAGIEELTAEQRAVIHEAREAAPAAAAAINSVSGQLTTAITTTENAMKETRKAIQEASTSLTTTVNAITTGVEEYTKLIAELHGEMDKQLAGAIGRLDTTVNSLGETMDELVETIGQVQGGRSS